MCSMPLATRFCFECFLSFEQNTRNAVNTVFDGFPHVTVSSSCGYTMASDMQIAEETVYGHRLSLLLPPSHPFHPQLSLVPRLRVFPLSIMTTMNLLGHWDQPCSHRHRPTCVLAASTMLQPVFPTLRCLMSPVLVHYRTCTLNSSHMKLFAHLSSSSLQTFA